MAEKRKSAATRTLAVLAIAAVFSVPLYVLSIGPADWLARHGYVDMTDDSPLERFYRPLGQAMIKYPTVNRPMKWYLSLWRPSAPTGPPEP